jgi:hypothetical protein
MRVISVTPAGRRRFLQVLVPHLLRQRSVIDEHHWWLNTSNESDIAYARSLTAQYPDFFKVCHKPTDPALSTGQSIWRFFRDYCDQQTLYVRLDDDICYMSEGAVEALVRARLADRRPLLVVGNIVNNAVCTHFHQQAGLVPRSWGQVENDCLDLNGWKRGRFACRLHALFLADVRARRESRWKAVELPIDGTRRFSINAISWFGSDLAGLPEIRSDQIDEEPFLTEELPRRLNRPNAACPEALFAHFAFWTQRAYLEWTWPELIGHYQALAEGGEIRLDSREPAFKLLRDIGWRLHRPVKRLRDHVQKQWTKTG